MATLEKPADLTAHPGTPVGHFGQLANVTSPPHSAGDLPKKTPNFFQVKIFFRIETFGVWNLFAFKKCQLDYGVSIFKAFKISYILLPKVNLSKKNPTSSRYVLYFLELKTDLHF